MSYNQRFTERVTQRLVGLAETKKGLALFLRVEGEIPEISDANIPLEVCMGLNPIQGSSAQNTRARKRCSLNI